MSFIRNFSRWGTHRDRSVNPKKRFFQLLFIALLAGTSMPAYAQRWETTNSTSREKEIIRRYLSILEKNPTRGFAFKQILSRVGSGSALKKLIAEYKKKSTDNPKNAVYSTILGHLLISVQRNEEALKAYNQALTADPNQTEALLGRGEVLLAIGKQKEATEDFQKLLENEKDRHKKEEVLRKLADMAFANRDWKTAEMYYDQLVAMNPRDSFLRAEYADVLRKYARGEKALEQYDAIMKLNASNSKRRAEIYRDMGDVYSEMHNYDDAVAHYEKGMKLIRPSVWLYRELQHRIIDAYRAQNKLPELVNRLKKLYGSLSYDEAMVMGQLYEELSNDTDAKAAYLQAKRLKPRAVEPRVQLIRILEREGNDAQVLKEYNDLTRIAKGRSSYYFDLAKIHMRAGRKTAATKIFKQIERLFKNDDDVMAQLADTYVEYDMEKEALTAYKKIYNNNPKNDAYILGLADQYYRMGDTDKAVEVWSKLLESSLGEVEANVRLGQVLAEHGMTTDALRYFQHALEKSPNDDSVRRGIALAYERAGRYSEAIRNWSWLYEHANEPELMNESRRQMVRIMAKYGTLYSRIEQAEKLFAQDPDNYKEGLLAAQGYYYDGQPVRAEKILREIVKRTENQEDKKLVRTDTILSLVRFYESSNRLDDAIELLKQLAKESPLKKRAYYDRIAQLSLQLFDSNDAVKFAKLSIEANPDDSQAYARLGDIYLNMNELELASQQYEEAFKLDPQAWDVIYKLANIEQQLGDNAAAAENYKRVMQYSRDDNQVENAARKLISLASSGEGLESIEQQMYQLAFKPPRRDTFLLLVLNYYQWLVTPLVVAESSANLKEKEELRARLDSIGRRIAPLLIDAINTKNLGLRYRAVHLAGELHSRALLNPLISLLADKKQTKLHGEVIRTLVKIRDPRAIPALIKMNQNARSNDDILLSFWALGQFDSQSALDNLKLNTTTPRRVVTDESLAMALFGLGRHPATRPLLSKLFEKIRSKNQLLAVAWGLSQDPNAPIDLLKDLLIDADDLGVKKLAAIGLANSNNPESIQWLVRAYYDKDPILVSAAAAGLNYISSTRALQLPSSDEEFSVLSRHGDSLDFDFFANYLVNKRLVDSYSLNPSPEFDKLPSYQYFVKGVEGLLPQGEIADRVVRPDFDVQLGPSHYPSSNPKVRQLAAQMILAGTVSPQNQNLIVDLLQGKGTKESVIQQLYPKETPADLSYLEQLQTRLTAMQAALFLPDDQSQAIFMKALSDSDPVIRGAALRAFYARFTPEQLKQPELAKKLLTAIRKALRDSSRSVQIEGLTLAKSLNDPSLLTDIKAFMSNKLLKPNAARAVIQALNSQQTPEANVVASMWADYPDLYVRERAASSTSSLSEP